MESYLVVPAVQAVLYLLLIPVALKGHIRKSARLIFVLYLLAMCLWCALIIITRSGADAGTALVMQKIIVAAGVLMAGFFFHFSARYAQQLCKNWLLPFVYSATIAAAVLSLFGPVVSGFKVAPEGYFFLESGVLFPVVAGITLLVMVMGFICIGRSISKAEYSRERTRDIYVLTGFVIVTAGGLCEFLPFVDKPVCPGTIIGTVLFFVIILVALLKYRPLEIQRLMRTGLTYLLMALIVGLVYAGVTLLTSNWFEGPIPYWMHAILLILLVGLMRLTWDGVQAIVDGIVYRERYAFLKELKKFMLDAYDIRDYFQRGKMMVDLIAKSFQAKNVCLLIRNDGQVFETVLSAGEGQLPIRFSRSSELFRWLNSGNRILNTRDIETIPQLQTLTDEEKTIIRDSEIDLIVPLLANVSEVTGLLIVGRKKSRRMYSEDEMSLLVNVAESVASGVENARIHHFESLLIDELKNQDEKKTEFLHSVVHELKTPLTSLLSSTELLEEDMGEITTEQKNRIIGNIKRSATSMDRRVSELHDFTRSQTGNLELKLVPSDFGNIVREVTDQMITVIDDRKQKLKIEISDSLPVTAVDADKMQQAVVNLLSNASKFSPSDCEISLRVKAFDGSVIVEIEDCARIIETVEKEKIFEPYYRGKANGNQNRVPGLGLGLAIAKRIVELHKGKIWVDSVPEKGNIFSFSIPVHKEN